MTEPRCADCRFFQDREGVRGWCNYARGSANVRDWIRVPVLLNEQCSKFDDVYGEKAKR